MFRLAILLPMASKARVSLSIQRDLMDEFDALSESLGHPTRSKAVSEAMREFVSGRKWDLAKRGQVPGVILLTYDHRSRRTSADLTELQHDFPDVVTATMHLHLSKNTCLEVIAFKGQAERVRSLARTLQSQKGVLDLKLVTAPT
ncbi:MAG: nickel-responsive transcriptional regulator NikR [Thermoplasmata archaeon]